MSALFEIDAPSEPRRSASISADGLYRYSLYRDWRAPHQKAHWVTFVMLNPSTADGNEDDPTIRRCIGFARQFGGTGLAVVNLYAYRATKPTDLWKAADPVGPENDDTLGLFFAMAARRDMPIIAAWGANAKPDRASRVLAMAGADRLQALRVTKAGAPGHPLYLPANCAMSPWPPAPTT